MNPLAKGDNTAPTWDNETAEETTPGGAGNASEGLTSGTSPRTNLGGKPVATHQDTPVHPSAGIFPMMSGEHLAELVRSIRENGLREPVWLTRDGMVLDGRNRLKACDLAGVEPTFRTYEGDDPLKFVIDLNLHRRHLNESQRAMVAASLANLSHGANQHTGGAANLPILDDMPSPAPAVTQAEAATMLNVSDRSVRDAKKVTGKGTPELAAAVTEGKVSVSTAARLADLPAEEQREVLAADDEKKVIAKAGEVKRRGKRQRTAELAAATVPTLDRKYAVIYADPPWRYDFAETESRAIENNYPTMTHADIARLEVPAADDAVLFMWATNPKLREAFEVLDGWGFTYVTNMVWVKDKIGMGYYARSRHELLLIAKRGNLPTPEPRDRPDSVVEAVRGAHSSKPHVLYDLLERMYPGLPKVELFCRTPQEGWAAWGNEAS